MSNCRRALADAFRLLFKRPGVFLLIQTPGALLTLFDKTFMVNVENLPPAQSLPWIIPYFCVSVIMTSFISAATYMAVLDESEGNKSSFKAAFKKVSGQLVPLFTGSLITGAVILAGFYAYLIPGILVMCLYLFLPQVIMNEPGQPLMVYFNRSWKMARSHIWSTLALVTAILIITLLGYFSDIGFAMTIGPAFLHFVPSQTALLVASRGTQLCLTIVGEAVADLWVCCYFLKILKEGGNK